MGDVRDRCVRRGGTGIQVQVSDMDILMKRSSLHSCIGDDVVLVGCVCVRLVERGKGGGSSGGGGGVINQIDR